MKYLALGVIASTLSFNIHAEQLNYDFIEASFIQTGIDNIDEIEPKGFALTASKQFKDWYITANYTNQSDEMRTISHFNRATLDFDLFRFTLGAGFIQSFSPTTKLDYSLHLGQMRAKTSINKNSNSITTDTFLAQTQLRHLLTTNVEFNAAIGFERLQDDESENNFILKTGIQYFFNDSLSMSGYYRNAGDYTDIALSARYSF